MNPTQAYWNAIATLADVAELDRLNDERIAFERNQPIGQFVANYSAMGVVCDIDSAKAEIDAEVA